LLLRSKHEFNCFWINFISHITCNPTSRW